MCGLSYWRCSERATSIATVPVAALKSFREVSDTATGRFDDAALRLHAKSHGRRGGNEALVATSETARLARLRAQIINSKDLPTIPVLLARIVAVVDGDRSSTRDLVEVMQRDQALAGRVLRLANSGFFGFGREVSTLARAVMVLGFNAVRSLALGIKVWETLIGQRDLQLTALWEHSALVGAAARLIAQRTRAADPEEVFTAGLLHDVGRVVLALRFPAEYAAVLDAADHDDVTTPLAERERFAFGVDHAQAGAWLGERWALPPAIVEAAARHHEPIEPGTPLRGWVIVNLANRLVHWTDLLAASDSDRLSGQRLGPPPGCVKE
jgi:putative nucleotidyltransferase with HDIG domain